MLLFIADDVVETMFEDKNHIPKQQTVWPEFIRPTDNQGTSLFQLLKHNDYLQDIEAE